MTPKLFNLQQIKTVCPDLGTKAAAVLVDPVEAVEKGFIAYSEGGVVVPPVGELIFDDPPGEAHIKYGYIKGDKYYVIKMASGFYNNNLLGLPNSSGLMLLFNQLTGQLAGILLDEGYLTDVRTAAAGAVAARYLAPEPVTAIGVLGTGTQARMQVQYLQSITQCRDVMVWGIRTESALKYMADMEERGYRVTVCTEPSEVAANCNLIITTTPSQQPLLKLENIKPGTHITAMGSDTAEKNELDPQILAAAHRVAADSLQQCRSRGEIYKALIAGCITAEKPVELGKIITSIYKRRTTNDQITVADLTGVAIQDIQIASAVFDILAGA